MGGFMPKKYLIFLICLMASLYIHSLNPGSLPTQYKLDVWNDENGLPQNSVHAILQTGDGYLWLGTEEGIARFDGVKFTHFNEGNTGAIKNNYVRSFCEDHLGNLWIGTRGGGLLKYTNGSFEHFGKPQGLTHLNIYSICEDADYNLWIGTEDGGLFKMSATGFTRYTEAEGLLNKTVRNLFKDSKGMLWIATLSGMNYMESGKLQSLPVSGGIEKLHIGCIYEDHLHNLWAGTDEGLFKLDKGILKPYAFTEKGKALRIYSILEDSDRNLWLGSTPEGLICLTRDRKKTKRLTRAHGLSDNSILAIAEDREGSLWLGTAFGGLNRLADQKVQNFSIREGLCDDIIFSVFADREDTLWVGTSNGISHITKDNTCTAYTTRDGLAHNGIAGISQDRQGFIWVSTDNGVTRFKSLGKSLRSVKSYLKDGYKLATLKDSTGTVWVGGIGGLFRKPSGKKNFTQVENLVSNNINLIYEDGKKNIWISTYRNGLTLYKQGKFKVFDTKDGLADNSLNCIHEDTDGILWLGTINGLSRFDGTKFANITQEDGLYNNNIYQILEDNHGFYWMSCNKGIFKVSKKELHQFTRGEIKRVHCTAFGKTDGMNTSECNGGYQAAGCKTADGRLWFPTSKGVVTLDPANIKTNKTLPPVHIEQVLLDGKPVSQDRVIVIEPGIKRIEFNYTALSFLYPKKVLYKYKLDGYDTDWVDAGVKRTAVFTNLDPGNYTFNITACNNDGLWNEEGVWAEIRVTPPYWRTWWFTVIALIAFALFSHALILFFRRYLTLTQFWKKQKYIGSFKIIDKIGEGGMGTIYKANNLHDKTQTVAIKVLKDELFKTETNRKRFKQEAAIIDQLDHPNIVKIFERGQSRQNMYIAMEFLEGRTLGDKIRETGKISLPTALSIMLQVTDALSRIHQKTIIHRDLKPDNIMLINQDGNPDFVKLLDFGLARTESQTRLTQTGMVIGTLNYMAPEQIAGSEFSFASDIYSLGVIFYEIVTGELPFIGESTIDIMKQILDKTPIEPIKFQPAIGDHLNRLVMAMLNKDNSERPEMQTVLTYLEKIRVAL